MALTIDELNIQIAADSKQGVNAIDSLIDVLGRFEKSLDAFKSAANKIGSGLNDVEKKANTAKKGISGFIVNLANGNKPMQKFTDNLANQISKWRTLFGAFKSVANMMAGWFNESNDYIETLNLFNVTMGEGAEEARKYAESVSNLMGIDPAEWMQNQGVFKNLVSGFGVAEEASNTMSQNLTQLSYDMASFFNTDVETAFDKLSSAMSGQVKGLREFGIDTTVASLQEYALAKGIDKSVRSMTQAEKSMLRYNYIMEKSIIMQGDMARTIITPANSLRILNAQFTQLKRALGNVISVIVVQFIPYVQAMVEIITDAAKALADTFGFELPTIDYSGLDTGGFADDLEEGSEAMENTADTLKKIKKQLMGFDELNIISNPDTDSGSSGASDTGGGALGMKPLEYNFLEGLKTEKVDEIKEKLYKILEVAKWIGTAIAGWKLGSFIADLVTANIKVSTLKEAFALLGKKAAITVGITLAITGLALEVSGIKGAIEDGLDGIDFGKILGGGGILTGGAALLGKGVAGATGAAMGSGIGAVIAGLPAYFVGIYDAIMNGLDWLNGLLIPAGATAAGAGIGAIIGSLGGPIGTGMGALIGLIVGAVTDLVILVVQKWEPICAWFETAFTAIGQFFVDVWNGIVAVWNTVAEWFNTWVIQPVANFFVGLWNGISSAASACWNAIVEFFTPAIEWFTELFNSIFETISDIFHNIGVIASGCWEIIKEAWKLASQWFDEEIIQPIANFFSDLWDGIKTAASNAWEGIKNVLSPVGKWINEEIVKPVGKLFSNLWNGFTEGAKKAWEGTKEVFSKVGTFFKDTFKKAWQGIVDVFSIAGEIFVDIKDGIVTAFKFVVNGIIKGINKVVSLPFEGINDTLRWLKDLEILKLKPFAGIETINIPQIPLLASGGIVNEGQMFIAREAGPELVGSIGRKTAVANNDQIISGIESGVYRAMMAANSTNGGGTQTIRIINEIDGDVVGEKVIKYHNGKVMQTGTSPLLV